MRPDPNILDRLISYVAPAIGYKRMAYRAAMYAAAKSDRLTGGWSPADGKPSDIIAASNPLIRKRVRQLVRDFPYFKRALSVLVDYTVGSGIKFQSRVSDGGEINANITREIEDQFKAWSKICDITGKTDFDGIVRLAKTQDVESGEFFIIKHYMNDGLHPCPLRLQIIEPDEISSMDQSYTDGILLDNYGRPIKYSHIDENLKTTYISTDYIIHGFERLRPGQVRGVSPFVSGIMLSKDLQEYLGAEIDAAKLAAKWLAIVETPDPVFAQSGFTTENNQKITELENGIIEYLRPGEKMNLQANPRPGTNFQAFVRLVLQMFSVATGVPFEFLSGDYSGMNYSTIRTIRNDFKYSLKPIHERHIKQCCQPIFEAFMRASDAVGLWSFNIGDGVDYLRSEWQPPGMDPVDHLKESKADIEMISAGLKSPQEVARSRGYDLEFIYSEIQEAKKLAKKYGVNQNESNTDTGNSANTEE